MISDATQTHHWATTLHFFHLLTVVYTTAPMKTAAQMMKSLKVDSFVYSTGTDLSSAGVAHVPEVDTLKLS